jgi:hypothetical protein
MLVPDRGFPAVSPPGALMRRRPIAAEMSNFMDASLGLASGTDASSGASSPSSPSLSGSTGASVASWVDIWADGAGHFPRHSGRATPRSGHSDRWIPTLPPRTATERWGNNVGSRHSSLRLWYNARPVVQTGARAVAHHGRNMASTNDGRLQPRPRARLPIARDGGQCCRAARRRRLSVSRPRPRCPCPYPNPLVRPRRAVRRARTPPSTPRTVRRGADHAPLVKMKKNVGC